MFSARIQALGRRTTKQEPKARKPRRANHLLRLLVFLVAARGSASSNSAEDCLGAKGGLTRQSSTWFALSLASSGFIETTGFRMRT